MDRHTVRSELNASQKRRRKMRANVVAAMASCLWFERLPTGLRHLIVLHLLVRSGHDMLKLVTSDD